MSTGILTGKLSRSALFNSRRYVHNKKVRIGCSSGFWGDTPTAVPQLLQGGNIQYLVCDYLSEITMSLLAAARSKNPQLGFTPDFVESIAPYLGEIKNQGIRVVTNGGGINPAACAAMLQSLSKKAGVEMNIAQVTGDDLMPARQQLEKEGIKEVFSAQSFPMNVNSMNAYYGAGPVVKALELGADIVITGRCTDSALALAPLMHEFGWKSTDLDKLAAGSLAGHLIECGTQVTGGNHTDWEKVPGFENLGFPVAEVKEDGEILITKSPGTGGLLTLGSVGEQMLYEIGDTQSYILPDVVADFSNVQMEEVDEGVRVWGAQGRSPTPYYKISATYLDGFKATCVVNFTGRKSADKCHLMAESIFKRSRSIFKRLNIPDFEKVHVQVLGAEESFGESGISSDKYPREGVLWMAVKHQDKKALQIWSKEIAACGTGGTPGITVVVGGRPKPVPCLKLYSFLYPKSKMDAKIEMNEQIVEYSAPEIEVKNTVPEKIQVSEPNLDIGSHIYRLEELAYTRSGDKGNSSNIGVIARHPAFLPYIRYFLSRERVANHFKHVFEGPGLVKRYECPGIHALNFVLESSLGGGGIASLRPDPQGKAYGQILGELQLVNMPSKQDIIKKSESMK
ncbi:uncharacterized protein LOC111706988 [Eurytemora carolleeae]|uniref:uncharacterized protein LOC111706988 n=1 Tax=Eurytemora carolleeae TaxID=1294199 RepID=UPI000C77DF49|nr:uncharacterized protein LOC111706988 [Eurytemora carolleeae]XP_023335733.1 uncharacterized protein LOC111706988 [Eurytemora carolleeae]|eukprot:XP_023335725.1 uncharacterized protein LOC111706988 [Eurytemora affinis]